MLVLCFYTVHHSFWMISNKALLSFQQKPTFTLNFHQFCSSQVSCWNFMQSFFNTTVSNYWKNESRNSAPQVRLEILQQIRTTIRVWIDWISVSPFCWKESISTFLKVSANSILASNNWLRANIFNIEDHFLSSHIGLRELFIKLISTYGHCSEDKTLSPICNPLE